MGRLGELLEKVVGGAGLHVDSRLFLTTYYGASCVGEVHTCFMSMNVI